MYARLTIVHLRPDKLAEATQIFAESVIPAAKQQKGFISLHLLTDQTSGKGIAVGFWESEADAITNEQGGYYQEQVGKFKDWMTAPPVREGYEVGASS
jgi:heme-degrading monooxygenase HmoA